MFKRLFLLCALALMPTAAIAAQPAPADSITLSPPELSQGIGLFGEAQWQAVGTLKAANGPTAWADVVLYATVYDADGAVIGEGFGGPVDACGLSFRPDAPLQPNESASYRVALELDSDALTPASVELELSASPVSAAPVNPFLTYPHVTELLRGEVVRLEWTPDGLLRFATGCEDRAFIDQDWYEYDPVAGDTRPIQPPNADRLDAAVLRRLELSSPADLAHAKLQFHPADRRIIYQDPINVILTAEADGTYQRLLWDGLSRISLQGYVWLPQGRFLAYYYGAYGDEVRYFTGSVAGQKISSAPLDSVPSLIVPGSTPDGARVVIAVPHEGTAEYRLQSTINPARFERLFEGDAPGNHYPAPVYIQQTAGAHIYLVREVDGVARLQCYDTASRTLNDLIALPLMLTPGERALTALSPDGQTLALAAEGRKGGAWRIDLSALPCRPA